MFKMLSLIFFTSLILYLRLKIQHFETPTFRKEDNPAAFADEKLTRLLTQNYLYFLNLWLLINPDWLAFDWSFDSIELLRDINDLRIVFVLAFYIFMLSTIVVGFQKR
jgi:Domain of unknown function (DUF1736)